jgi:hypothetical protein
MMMNNAPAKVFNSEAEAQAVVALLMEDDGDFVFKVDVSPNGSGKAIILVIDEDGLEIAKFG